VARLMPRLPLKQLVQSGIFVLSLKATAGSAFKSSYVLHTSGGERVAPNQRQLSYRGPRIIGRVVVVAVAASGGSIAALGQLYVRTFGSLEGPGGGWRTE
jgi:hypothetical protein